MSVLVVHPQVQHSRRLVRALEEHGILEQFVTSFFGQPWITKWVPTVYAEKIRRRYDPIIPREKVRTFPQFEILWLFAARFLRFLPLRHLLYYNLRMFDLMVSNIVATSKASIVVCYEISALHIFREAKRTGKLCVLDASSVHYRCQETPEGNYPPRLKENIESCKEEEIRLADRILVLSSYARDTYIAHGVDERKLMVIPLGIDSGYFSPAKDSRQQVLAGITFLFVGNVSYAKGVDLLLRAFEDADITGKHLLIVGAPGDATPLLRPESPGIEVLGHVSHERLVEIYRQVDVFVLPSRLDGFGMVVAEAMATGLPAIVSNHVGAKDLVIDDENGWIFDSGDSTALRIAMERAYCSREHLPRFGLKARSSVEEFSWRRYGNSVGSYFLKLLDELHSGDC